MFDIKSEPGIYQIYNKTNNKRYIGSTLNISRRWTQHLHLLRNGKHHSKHLQSAWNKYGEDSFVFECIQYCEPDCLLSLEHKYIVEYKATDREYGYNITEDVERVAVMSKEDRQKIAAFMRSRKWTEEQRRKFIESRTGKKLKKSSETKKRQFREGTVHLVRMSEVSKEKYDEWRKHMSEARRKYFESLSEVVAKPVMLQSETEVLYFPSIKAAAEYLNVHRDSLWARIKKGTPTKKIPYIVSHISVEFYKSIKNV